MNSHIRDRQGKGPEADRPVGNAGTFYSIPDEAGCSPEFTRGCIIPADRIDIEALQRDDAQ